MATIGNKSSFYSPIIRTGLVTNVHIEAELGFRSFERDTSLRKKFISSMNLENLLSSSELNEINPLLQSFDVGHVIELHHGGTNSFDNLLLESKSENRAPGTKRQLETLSDQMLVSGKSVRIFSDASFDDRLPFKAPYQWDIEQEVCFGDGRLYQSYHYSMSNEPYLALATSPAVRRTLIKYDLKECTTEFGYSYAMGAAYGMLVSTSDSICENFKRSLKIGFKVALPYIAKAGLKIGLDQAQTAKCLPLKTKNTLATINVNEGFNLLLNFSAKLCSEVILHNEIKSNYNG